MCTLSSSAAIISILIERAYYVDSGHLSTRSPPPFSYVTYICTRAQVRIFAHSVLPGHAMQTSPGVYNEAVFRGLDYALQAASSRGFKVGHWHCFLL